VHDVVERIPPGRVTTSASIGDELDVPAPHVAYIISRLPTDTPLPWHRVVAQDGALSRGRRGAEQQARLTSEGLRVEAGRVADLDEVPVDVPLDEHHRASADTPLERRPMVGSGTD
jgi:alkylated DNA nucleotide flippase Atl1